MSQLDRILSSIFSDINSAKAQADMTSREIANRYISDDILQYFPIPRVGIENLEVELKYVIEYVEEKVENTSQSQQRLADFVQKFSISTAQELRKAISNEAKSNELYQELEGYPDQNWEINIAEMLSGNLKSIDLSSPTVQNTISKSFQSIQTEIKEVVPRANLVGSFASVPTLKGTYSLISLDEKGQTEFKLKDEFANERTAITEAKALIDQISKSQLKVSESKSTGNVNTAKLISGRKQLDIIAKADPANKSNAKNLFDSSIAKKAEAVKNAPIANSWVLGKKISPQEARNTNTAAQEKPDETLFNISKSLLNQKSIDFQNGIRNILDQSKITTLKVAVDAEKLSKAKPDSILTLKFNLSAKDFAMISDSDAPSNF
ncbi:hypothetical protein [Belliella pelovolcani]|uniref:hypothetical protein n=1 Tax=Belliella pelovolcani TaxID=529505 RepID=UPI0039188173